jgi:hypothetical protein
VPLIGGPPHKLALWEKVIGVAILSLIGALAVFFVEFNFAPWEIAYRQRGLEVMRTELAALPSVDGVTGPNPLENSDGPNILAQYPLRVSCEEVYAHYRQVALAAGWTFLRSEPDGVGDDYAGTFEGYYIHLEVGRDTSGDHPPGSGRYEVLVSIDFPHNIKGLP